MPVRDKIDGLISSAMTAAPAIKGDAGPCPEDSTLAAYLDRTLDRTAVDGVESHIAACPDCMDTVLSVRDTASMPHRQPPARLRDAALKTAGIKSSSTFELVIRMVRDALELVSTTGSSAPFGQPAYQMRSSGPVRDCLLSVSQDMGRITVGVDVESIDAGLTDIMVSARASEGSAAPSSLRASLFKGSREQGSLYMDGGTATFERMPASAYTIIITGDGASLGEIHLSLLAD